MSELHNPCQNCNSECPHNDLCLTYQLKKGNNMENIEDKIIEKGKDMNEYLLVGQYKEDKYPHRLWNPFYEHFDDLKKAQHRLQILQKNHEYQYLKLYKIEEVKGDNTCFNCRYYLSALLLPHYYHCNLGLKPPCTLWEGKILKNGDGT